jgi:general stress protein YciG
MDPERQREIAAEGGRAAHASGNAHEFSSQEAREAGSKSHGGNQASSQAANNTRSASSTGSTRGGSSEQPSRAGSQSHKNDR